ncbi:MAG: hypothetical protein JSV92_03870 [archaeon]|nr:MAG: hypothetical protein JSV92_03870 [archaeon]
MEFYDLNIQLEDLEELDEVIEMAKRLGYSGIGLIEKYANLDRFNKIREKAKKTGDLRIIPGIEVGAEGVRELKRAISKAKKHSNFIIVSGGEYKINRAASEDSRVSIISHPEYKRSDSGVDHVIAKFASDNGVAIEINFHEILETFRKIRSFVLSHMRLNVELAQKYGARVVINSGARGKWDMRDPRELAAIGQILGMNLEDSMNSVSEIPKSIVR